MQGNGLSEFLKALYMDSYPSTQMYLFSLKGVKVKKKLGIITMQRDEADKDAVCASGSFSTVLG